MTTWAQGVAAGTCIQTKVHSSCCPLCPRTIPSPEERTLQGVMYGVLLWADMNAATPLGASDISLADGRHGRHGKHGDGRHVASSEVAEDGTGIGTPLLLAGGGTDIDTPLLLAGGGTGIGTPLLLAEDGTDMVEIAVYGACAPQWHAPITAPVPPNGSPCIRYKTTFSVPWRSYSYIYGGLFHINFVQYCKCCLN